MDKKPNEQKQQNSGNTDPILVIGIALIPIAIALINTEAKPAGFTLLAVASGLMLGSVAKQMKKNKH